MNASLDNLKGRLLRLRQKQNARKETSTPRKGAPPAVPQGTPLPLPPVIVRSLRKVGSRQACVSLGESATLLLAVLPALLLFQAVADWSFNLPWLVRLILLSGDLAVGGVIIYRFAVQPLSHGFSLERVALRVESELTEFRSSLISAVELATARPGTMQGSPELVRELLVRVVAHVREKDLARSVVKTANLKKWCRWAAVSVMVAGAVTVLFWPASRVLIARILLSHAPLPTRTLVVPISRDEATLVGTDLTLAARAEGAVPKSGTLLVVFANKDRQTISVNPSPDDPAVFSVTMQNVQQPFSYHFVLNDGVGADFQVTARTAPVLKTFRVVQTYPGYTGLPAAEMAPGHFSFLAGSTVHIEGQASESLQGAAIQLEGVPEKVAMRVKDRAISGEFTVPREGLTGFSLPLTNTAGVASQNDTVYHVELIPDNAPKVELSSPSLDQMTVVLRAQPRLIFSASDDFALKKLVLKYEVTRPPLPDGTESAREAGAIPLELPKPGQTSQVFLWNLAGQMPALAEGCSLMYWIEASDNNNVTGPGIGLSPKKSLSIVSMAEKRAEIVAILDATASDLDEVADKQKTTNESLNTSIRKAKP